MNTYTDGYNSGLSDRQQHVTTTPDLEWYRNVACQNLEGIVLLGYLDGLANKPSNRELDSRPDYDR